VLRHRAEANPRLLVSEHLNSPLALTGGGEPAILFPTSLVSRLDQAELEGALAHEMAHFQLRRPNWCSAGTLQKLTLINPVANLVREYLHRQEEKACDEVAVSIVGQPDMYAAMLTKSYRYAKEQSNPIPLSRLQGLPRLLGFKPLLSERIEHLLHPESQRMGWQASRIIVWVVWAALFGLLFFSFSATPS